MALPRVKRRKAHTSVKIQILTYTFVFSVCLLIILCISNLRVKQSYGNDEEANVRLSNVRGSSNLVNEKRENDDQERLSLVILKTTEGNIRVKLRPDLSLPSVQYIQRLLDDPSPCSDCNFYRAEKPGILQGILAKDKVEPNTILGECPEGLESMQHDCPEHDPNCGCHGPIMTKGMIGWAAGEGGPDFFIDTYKRAATWWNTDHTVFGEIADEESMEVVMGMYELPATKSNDDELTYLDVPVQIELSSP